MLWILWVFEGEVMIGGFRKFRWKTLEVGRFRVAEVNGRSGKIKNI